MNFKIYIQRNMHRNIILPADDNWILMATSAGGHSALNAARNMPKNVKVGCVSY